MAALIPVGPGIPEGVRAILKSHADAIQSLRQPGAPTAVLSTTVAKLPAPANYPPSIAIVTDIPALAFSDGTNWRRSDTNAIIV